MKKLIKPFLILISLGLLSSCYLSRIKEKQDFSRDMVIELDTLHMVIKYDRQMNEQEKKVFKDTNHFKPVATKSCDCGDTDIELLEWNYDEIPQGEIQTARNQLKNGGGGAQGDDNFTMEVYPLADDSSPYKLTPISKLKLPIMEIIANRTIGLVAGPSGRGLVTTDAISDPHINIAVIDTGVDTEKLKNFDQFLYPTADIVNGCPEQVSGWNFAYGNENTYDDHGHGTNVIRIIGKNLQSAGIPYRILPIKAFDEKGKASYIDMVCSLNYVKKINDSGKGNIHILNTSFGYGFKGLNMDSQEMQNYKDNSIFRELIEDINQTTIISASAGNVEDNIDMLELSNYPASFPSENLIGVGGYNGMHDNLEPAGNFGPNNLDLAAQYKTVVWSFLIWKKGVQGSSFSTAHNTSTMARIFHSLKSSPLTPDPSPAMVRSTLINPGQGNWVDYNLQQLGNYVDQGRYRPE